jgi:hypothetical protein
MSEKLIGSGDFSDLHLRTVYQRDKAEGQLKLALTGGPVIGVRPDTPDGATEMICVIENLIGDLRAQQVRLKVRRGGWT